MALPADELTPAFIARHCIECHNSVQPESGLDLTSLSVVCEITAWVERGGGNTGGLQDQMY